MIKNDKIAFKYWDKESMMNDKKINSLLEKSPHIDSGCAYHVQCSAYTQSGINRVFEEAFRLYQRQEFVPKKSPSKAQSIVGCCLQ